jgi:RNA polymerase sigma-70 factor (sigma-E family)
MRRTAYLLCGDWHRAEDIVQIALIKLYVAWSRVRKGSADAYARKVLVRAAIDDGRRGFFQRERTVDAVPERAVTDSTADLDLRGALDTLPPGQRAVVVLRYWEDLSITETASILGRTEGTVKSQAAKGLAALRELLETEPELRIHRSEVIRKGRTKLARRRTAIASALVFVLVAGLGTAGYLVRPTSPAGMSSATDPVAEHNAQLTELLRKNYRLPAGITAEDVPEINAKAFEFYTRPKANIPDEKDKRRAVARLRDAQGIGGVAITIERVPENPSDGCAQNQYCRSEERDGIKIETVQPPIPGRPGEPERLWMWVIARYPDGTSVRVISDNMGVFEDSPLGEPGALSTARRPTPVLDREEMIKIATIPGLAS